MQISANCCSQVKVREIFILNEMPPIKVITCDPKTALHTIMYLQIKNKLKCLVILRLNEKQQKINRVVNKKKTGNLKFTHDNLEDKFGNNNYGQQKFFF